MKTPYASKKKSNRKATAYANINNKNIAHTTSTSSLPGYHPHYYDHLCNCKNVFFYRERLFVPLILQNFGYAVINTTFPCLSRSYTSVNVYIGMDKRFLSSSK